MSEAEVRDSGLAEVEAENERLREALAGRLDATTMLRELAIKEGGLFAQVEGGAAGLLAGAFIDMFDKHEPQDARNYIELSFGSKLGPIVVTVQKVNGKSPARLRAEAEAQRDSLARALQDALRAAEAAGVLADQRAAMALALQQHSAARPGQQATG